MVAPCFPHTSDVFEALISALWGERELLEELLFALSCQRLLLQTGSLRWLANSSSHVHDIITELREQELVRAVVTEGVVAELAGAPHTSLAELVSRGPQPQAAVLGDLLVALRELAAEVDQVVRGNDELLLGLSSRTPRADTDGVA